MINNQIVIAEIYTDGSCHTQHCIGGWCSILFLGEKKITLSGIDNNTTHNRMELLAVIRAVEYIQKNYNTVRQIQIVSDSQYVIGLIGRQDKFFKTDFKTNAGNDIRNLDLVKSLLELCNRFSIQFVKIKAHQKETANVNYNIEVDKICRKLVREAVNHIELSE